MAMSSNLDCLLRMAYVVFAFLSALCLGAFKGLIVGPVAASVLIGGNVGVILGMFPPHVAWTVYTLVKTDRLDIPLKVAVLLALPALFVIWLVLSIAASVIVGLGYGFFNPWVSTFEAFRNDTEYKKFYHCLVASFFCKTFRMEYGELLKEAVLLSEILQIYATQYHSYPLYLKELRESPATDEVQTLRLMHVPGVIIAGLLGLMVEIPLFTAIAVIKSPLMLFKGWFRLIHDLISREGPFLETACIPIAGLTILLWPLVVVGSIIATIFTSFFIGLYASVIVYQERSFRRGVAYVIAMVAEFDEYTNDWLYLREGTILPKPRYQKKRSSRSTEASFGGGHASHEKFDSIPREAPGMLVPSLAPSRSVRDTIQEVKMFQVWGIMMKGIETRGKLLFDTGTIVQADLTDYLKAKNGNEAIMNVGLPCYSLMQTLFDSIKAGSDGLLLHNGVELTYQNRPNDKLFDWFFNPLMVLKDQIRVINLESGEEKFLLKIVLYGNDTKRMKAWDNGSLVSHEPVRDAQIQGISRRMIGMARSVAKFPTYRRMFRQAMKVLVAYAIEKEGSLRSNSMRSVACIENV